MSIWQTRLLAAVLLITTLVVSSGCQESPKPSSAANENQSKPVSTPQSGPTTGPVSTPPAANPTRTAGPSLLAFMTKDGIALSTLDGKTVRQIIAGVDDYNPVWSPDGKKLAYIVRSPRDKIGLYVYSLEDGNSRKVADEAGLFMGYSWSPDSSRLAYNNNSTADMGIFVVDVATGVQTRISPKEDTITAPSWSPDGKWVAFHYLGPSGNGVRIVSPDGTEKKEIAGGSFINAPAWSPDSQRVALIDVSMQGNVFDLIYAYADGSGTYRILQGKGNSNQNPKWSPDGKRILYYATSTHEQIDYKQLWVTEVDGKNPKLYLETPKMGSASWAPDGASLTVSSDKDGPVLVHILSADGLQERAVAEGISPAWSPYLASAAIQQLGTSVAEPTPAPGSQDEGYVGLFLMVHDGDLLARIGQPVRQDGLVVTYVLPDSPAKAAGLAPKDLVLRIGNQDISGIQDYDKALKNLKTGDKVSIRYLRAGVEQNSEFIAKQRPANYELTWNNHMADIAVGSPNDAFMCLARGVAEQAIDTARSQFYFDRAIELDPNFASAYYWRATNHEYFGRMDQARADLDKAAKLTKDKILLDLIKEETNNLR